MTAPTTPPTAGEIARARARLAFVGPIWLPRCGMKRLDFEAVAVLLAALDAAERERDEARARYDAAAAENATLKDERDGAMDERDKAYLRLDAHVLALRSALLPPGAIVVSLDAETREAVAKALYEREYPSDGTWWTHADQQEWWDRADAVLAALRGVGR